MMMFIIVLMRGAGAQGAADYVAAIRLTIGLIRLCLRRETSSTAFFGTFGGAREEVYGLLEASVYGCVVLRAGGRAQAGRIKSNYATKYHGLLLNYVSMTVLYCYI